MAKFFVLLLALVFGISSAQENVIPPEIRVEIDALLESWMTSKNTPGLSLAITRGDGELVYTRGYGYRDVENRLQVDPGTLFGIGSITKSFAATVVIKKLNEMFPELDVTVLDTPIRILAPGYNFVLSDRYRSESVTFRDLLSHRVCTFPELAGMWVQTYTSFEDIYYRHRYTVEYCSFRNGYVYNNGLIGMAGDIIAHMANSTFNEMLSELLGAIGMNETTWVKESDDHNNMMGRSVPYIWKDDGLIRYNPELLKGVVIVNAAGGILSSAQDMMKYMQFQLNLGNVGGQQIVPEAVMGWLTAPSNLQVAGFIKTGDNPNATVDLNLAYGLCLNVGVYDGWLRVSHGGYIPPYESLMHLFPSLNLGIFVTMNGPGTAAASAEPVNALLNKIFDILQGNTKRGSKVASHSFSDLTVGPYPIIRERKENKVEGLAQVKRIEPEEAVGVFGSGFNGEMSLTMRTNPSGGQQLYVEYGVWGHGWLTQTSNATFTIEWDNDYWMLAWSNQVGPTEVILYFVDADTIQFWDNGFQSATNFERGLRVDDLPEIPYAPDSCGPEYLA
ncbi:uncharacterized protein LOC110859117 isoform X2 [Folsomia candida]|uniref:uncharacterized protein LOC110859117 isoform X2 n=1 Tax=Folsomia candida TaxID=158441 RepID=UPI000B8F4D72|nr:uncharacterized protein LOC110859117 isoform X2 [Folsomia candida]